MTLSINGVPLPLSPSVRDSGNYVYAPFAESRENGLDETVVAGLPTATWTYSVMEPDAYRWWTTTLMAGAFSLRCPAVLPDNNDVETSFDSVAVRYPTYGRRVNGQYYDVTVKIESMVKS